MNKKTKILNKENNRLDNEIKAENMDAFTDMIVYLRGSQLGEYEIEVVRNDLTNMVLEAQDRGESIESVVGGDYKEFCDNIIAALPKKSTKQKIIDFFDIFSFSFCILLVINLVFSPDVHRIVGSLFSGGVVDYSVSFTLSNIISILFISILSVLLVNFITKTAFSNVSKSKSLLIAGLFGAFIMIVFFLIAFFGRITLFTTNVFLVLAIIVILYIIHFILNHL